MTLIAKSNFGRAYAVAAAVDLLQIPVNLAFFGSMLATLGLSAVPLEGVDVVLDLAAAALLTKLIGFHWSLLPTLGVELVPGLDVVPTWTAAVAYVQHVRRTEGRIVEGE